MKKVFLSGLLCAAILFIGSLSFISCSKDDDNDNGGNGNGNGEETEIVDETVNVLTKIKDQVFKDRIMVYMKTKQIKAAALDFLTVAEAANVTELGLSVNEGGEKIESMEGIEYFTGVEKLYMNYLAATTVDLSKNKKLKELNALECLGKTLSIISPSVERIDLTYAKSESIMLDMPKLTYINCQDARSSELNTSKCPALKNLRCGGSKINALDLSQNPELEELSCGGSGNISSHELDISKNRKLNTLYAGMGNAPLLKLYVWWDGGRSNVPASFKTFFIEEKTEVLKKEN